MQELTAGVLADGAKIPGRACSASLVEAQTQRARAVIGRGSAPHAAASTCAALCSGATVLHLTVCLPASSLQQLRLLGLHRQHELRLVLGVRLLLQWRLLRPERHQRLLRRLAVRQRRLRDDVEPRWIRLRVRVHHPPGAVLHRLRAGLRVPGVPSSPPCSGVPSVEHACCGGEQQHGHRGCSTCARVRAVRRLHAVRATATVRRYELGGCFGCCVCDRVLRFFRVPPPTYQAAYQPAAASASNPPYYNTSQPAYQASYQYQAPANNYSAQPSAPYQPSKNELPPPS